MAFKAMIKNADGKEIENYIPYHSYEFISETLVKAGKNTKINPLRKYDERMPFHIFFASCVHNLLSEVSIKIHTPEPVTIFIETLTQDIRSIGGAYQRNASSFSAIEKFLKMITTHIGASKSSNYNNITQALVQLVQDHGIALDNPPYLYRCLALIEQFDIVGISGIEFTSGIEETSQYSREKKTFSLFKPATQQSSLEELCQRYQTPANDSAKLLRIIASTPNVADLERLSGTVPMQSIINEQSPTGKTALHWLVKKAQEARNKAHQAEYQKAFAWLVEHNANIALLDNDKKTALEYDKLNLFSALEICSGMTANITPLRSP